MDIAADRNSSDEKFNVNNFCMSNELRLSIVQDDRDTFVSEIFHRAEELTTQSQIILREVLCNPSIKCAEALITGQTPLSIDLNLPCHHSGTYPLHSVAAHGKCVPSVVELLIYYGAQTNIRLKPFTSTVQQFADMLPLQIALRRTAKVYRLSSWAPRHSVFKLVSIFCLPWMQNELEAIGLLAGVTEETEEVFLECAMQGSVKEFTALLLVAHKRLHNVMHKVRQFFNSNEKYNLSIREEQYEKVASMQLLIDVFEIAGDKISAYLKEDKFFVTEYQTVLDVTRLLLEAGLQLQQTDVDLSCYSWFETQYTRTRDALFRGQRCLDDFGMAHYSKSGYRWKVSKKDLCWKSIYIKDYINELKNEAGVLKAENANIKKQSLQPNLGLLIDAELRKILDEDDREEFISVIDRNLDRFHSREQQLLYVVCISGSIKCAEALLKGDTRLAVELNHPCTDAGMYPLHCAALSLFPSIMELFLFSGARTDIKVRPCNTSDVHPHYLLEGYANKLPLHMALLGISHLPCIREWRPKHPITKLVTLLCLPRMQNPLETLCLLVGTTQKIAKECIGLAIDGKVVELTAMAIAMLINVKFDEIKEDMEDKRIRLIERGVLDEEQEHKLESSLCFLKVFDEAGEDIADYVKEEKYDVTKYQAIEDVRHILLQNGFPLRQSDTDLSVYRWYRDEEPSYPSEAPYENVRQLHDVGMDHYSRSGFRWEVTKKELYTWWRYAMTEAYVSEMENHIERLKEENAKEKKQLQQVLNSAVSGVPYIYCHANIFSEKVPIDSSILIHTDVPKPKLEDKSFAAFGVPYIYPQPNINRQVPYIYPRPNINRQIPYIYPQPNINGDERTTMWI